MLTYDLKTGYSCNNHCKHCVIEDSRDKLMSRQSSIDLSTDECLQQVDYAAQQGASYIVLTGGEVTIRKDFPLLVAHCAQHNLDVTIQTNGRMLDNPNVIQALCSYNKIRCVIALHAARAETHDSITQVKGSFEETCNGIRCAVNQNILVVLKIVISKINEKELPLIVDLASDLGVKYACFAFPHGQGGARRNFDEIIPSYTELSPHLKNLIKEAELRKVHIEFEAIPFCIIPSAMQLVGELKYRSGNTLCKQVGDEIFDWSKVRQEIKTKAPQCEQCDMNNSCEGAWSEYADVFGTDEFTPIFLPEKLRRKIIDLSKPHE